MAKDRAAPFSRKHRKYWIPVTGGMILIGCLNLAIGFCSYSEPSEPPQRLELHLPPPTTGPVVPGAIGLAQLPTAVMRTFARTYPQTVPAGAVRQDHPDGARYVLTFPAGAAHHHATFREDGTLLGTD